MKNYKIAVAGTGYVGLSLGVLFAQHHQVVAVDIVQAKVDMINNKKSPIQDDYIEKYLAENDADPVIYNQLGLCKLETEDYEAALTAINSGLSVTENNSVTQELRFNQIVAYEHLGNFKKAAALMNSYLDSYPDDAAAIRENEFLKTR